MSTHSFTLIHSMIHIQNQFIYLCWYQICYQIFRQTFRSDKFFSMHMCLFAGIYVFKCVCVGFRSLSVSNRKEQCRKLFKEIYRKLKLVQNINCMLHIIFVFFFYLKILFGFVVYERKQEKQKIFDQKKEFDIYLNMMRPIRI